VFGPTGKLHMSSRWAIVSIAAVAGAALAGCASGATAQTPSPTTANTTSVASTDLAKPVVLTVVQNKWLPTGVTHLGDTTAQFLGATDEAGHNIGYNAYTCTVVATGQPSDKLQCVGSLVLHDGSIESIGVVDRTSLETPGAEFDSPVTSGTSAYRGLRGAIRWTQLPPDANGAARARGVFISA
jgi:hypothetical protein